MTCFLLSLCYFCSVEYIRDLLLYPPPPTHILLPPTHILSTLLLLNFLQQRKCWSSNCCVFRPPFGCCAHPKVGQNLFFSRFSTFFVHFKAFSVIIKELRMRRSLVLQVKHDICQTVGIRDVWKPNCDSMSENVRMKKVSTLIV